MLRRAIELSPAMSDKPPAFEVTRESVMSDAVRASIAAADPAAVFQTDEER